MDDMFIPLHIDGREVQLNYTELQRRIDASGVSPWDTLEFNATHEKLVYDVLRESGMLNPE